MKNEFLESKECKSLIKLMLWIVFIGILFFVSTLNNKSNKKSTNNENQTEIKEFKSLENMENDLLTKSLSYKYKISDEGNLTIYEGMRCDNKEIWYKENSDGITKYMNEDGITYKMLLDVKEEYNDEIQTLNDLFTTLKDYNYNETKNDTERDIKYNLGTISVDIKTTLENITNILVSGENVEYEMQFTNIGICDNISFNE